MVIPTGLPKGRKCRGQRPRLQWAWRAPRFYRRFSFIRYSTLSRDKAEFSVGSSGNRAPLEFCREKQLVAPGVTQKRFSYGRPGFHRKCDRSVVQLFYSRAWATDSGEIAHGVDSIRARGPFVDRASRMARPSL